MIGETLGSYRIISLLGEGGMGRVYLAEHALIGRRAAIKILLEQFSTNQAIVNRFFNEARTTALIKHPGLVDIFDFGYHQSGSAYIIMELLEGKSLADRLRQQRVLSVAEALEIARQAATAIAAAHAKGIIHRDLKPDNIHLVDDNELAARFRVKILDFGIAKLAGDAGGNKTRTGAVLGTPAYMSPEQCRDTAGVDGRSDVYALGCILFEMLCGRPPFVGDSVGDLVAAQLRDQPPHPQSLNPALPAPLAATVLRMLAKLPEDRPANMTSVVAELEATLRPAPAMSRPTVQTAAWRPPDAAPAMPSQAPDRHDMKTPKSVQAVQAAPAKAAPPPLAVPPPRAAPVARGSAVVSSTTLSGSSGELQKPGAGRRRGTVVAGAAAVVLSVAGLTWFSMSHDGKPEVAASASTLVQPTEPTRPVEPSPPVAAAPPPVSPEVAPSAPPAVAPSAPPAVAPSAPPAVAPSAPPAVAPSAPPLVAPSPAEPTSPANEAPEPSVSPQPGPGSDVRNLDPVVVQLPRPKASDDTHAVASITLRITSTPPGAEVSGPNGDRLGVTPFTRQVPRSERALRYGVRMDGHKPGSVEFRGDRSERRYVVLDPLTSPAPSSAGGEGAPSRPVSAPPRPAPGTGASGRSKSIGSGILDPFKDAK